MPLSLLRGHYKLSALTRGPIIYNRPSESDRATSTEQNGVHIQSFPMVINKIKPKINEIIKNDN